MARNRIIFFDINSDIVEEMKKCIKYDNAIFVCDDVRKIINNHCVDILVSLANSMGYMDGGIDGIYSRMSKGVQKTVMDKIKSFNIRSDNKIIQNKYVIPIGSVIAVNINSDNYPSCKKLFVCPTMEYPKNIKDTPKIIYHCMCGLLNLQKKYYNKTIAIPGLGTYTGKLSPKIMCEKINRAISEFENTTEKYQDYLIENTLDSFVMSKILYLV